MKSFNFRKPSWPTIIKDRWPLIVAVVVSLCITYFAYSRLQPIIYQQEAFADVIVAAKDLRPYSTITISDLGTKKILKTMVNKKSIQEPDKLIGKVVKSSIRSGESIMDSQLDDAENLKNKRFISIPTDLSRSVGGVLRPGDLVDVWWVDNAVAGQWRQVAANVNIVDILDSSGNTVNLVSNDIGTQNLKNTIPNIVILAVDKDGISPLIGGAIPETKLVLVKKLINDTEIPVIPTSAPTVSKYQQ